MYCQEAEAAWREALAVGQGVLYGRSPVSVRAGLGLANCLYGAGRWAEALPLYTMAAEVALDVMGCRYGCCCIQDPGSTTSHHMARILDPGCRICDPSTRIRVPHIRQAFRIKWPLLTLLSTVYDSCMG